MLNHLVMMHYQLFHQFILYYQSHLLKIIGQVSLKQHHYHLLYIIFHKRLAIACQQIYLPKLIGLKNSSMPVMDIERFRRIAGDDFIIFNGPDEQFVSGRLIGADSGIGGTYASMPELLIKANEFVSSGDFAKAKEIQADIN